MRWAIIGVAVVVLAVEVVLVRDQLAKAWGSLLSANWWWVLAAVFAALGSMHSFAQIQRTLLKSAGVEVKQWRSEAAFYAGNALSTTMPGGPVLSATFVYRQQRLWGASPVVASWQLVMSGVLQVVGLALLGLAGAFLLGASKNPLSLIFTLGGFVALLLLAQSVASNPQQIDGIGVRVLSWFNSLRGKPADTGPGQVARDAATAGVRQPEPSRTRRRVQLVAVQLGRRRGMPGLRRVRRRRQARRWPG